MSYREMNRAAVAVCGLIAFAILVMIGATTIDTRAAAPDAVTFFLN